MNDHEAKDLRFHADIAHVYDYLTVEPREYANELLFRRLAAQLDRGALMIDLGCGTGHMLERFGDRFARRIGVDHSPEMLAQARAKLAARGLDVDWREQTVETFLADYEGPLADFVSAVGFLHHLEPIELAGTLERISPIVAPGARLLVAEPVHTPRVPWSVRWINARSILHERLRKAMPESAEDPDEEPLVADDLLDALAHAGFRTVDRVQGFDLLHMNYPPKRWEKALFSVLHRLHAHRQGDVVAVLAERSRQGGSP